MDHLPIGLVLDQIACYRIAQCGEEEKKAAAGSLMEQMAAHYGR